MSRNKAQTQEDLPKVERGIRMPRKIVDGRAISNHERVPSAWPEFLSKLEVGDSFTIPWWKLASVSQYAKKLKLDLVTKKEEGRPGSPCRIWIYGKPGKRNPIYFKHGSRLFKAVQEAES